MPLAEAAPSRADRVRGLDGREPARFVEPMQCLAVARLPEGPNWEYEIKFDGCGPVAATPRLHNSADETP
jgi:ATP-dependent DNA ligase